MDKVIVNVGIYYGTEDSGFYFDFGNKWDALIIDVVENLDMISGHRLCNHRPYTSIYQWMNKRVTTLRIPQSEMALQVFHKAAGWE